MRPLSRNRRIAVICASSAAITATAPTLLSHAGSGVSDFGHGLFVGAALGVSIGLLLLSIIHMRRDGSNCSRNQTPGA